MSKMPVDRDRNLRSIFRRYGIPADTTPAEAENESLPGLPPRPEELLHRLTKPSERSGRKDASDKK